MRHRIAAALALAVLLAGHAAAAGEEGDAAPAAPFVEEHPTPEATPYPLAPHEGVQGAARTRGPLPENFIGVFGGKLSAGATPVDATSQCILCPPISASETLAFTDGPVAGLRFGMWGRERWRHVGIAAELGNSQISADRSKVEFFGFGVTPLLRWPLLRDAGPRSSQVAPYAGLLLFGISGGKVDLSLTGMPGPISGNPSGRATGVLGGIALSRGPVSVFLELRDVSLRVNLDSMAGDDATIRMDGRQQLIGIFYRR